MSSEVSQKANFSIIRYAQCWEDADILMEALNIRSAHTCVAIGSAGDNALAMLSRGPERLIALDISPAQIACLELRVAAYKELKHGELLELIGSTASSRRKRATAPTTSATASSSFPAATSTSAPDISTGCSGGGCCSPLTRIG